MREKRPFLVRLLRGWHIIFLLILALDLIVLPLHEPAYTFNWSVYAAAVALSLIFVLVIEVIRRLLPRGWRQVYVLLMSFVVALILAASVIVYRQFGEFVTVSMAQFVIRNPVYFESFVRSTLFNIHGLGLLALTFAIAWLWTPWQKPRRSGGILTKLGSLVLLGAIYLVILNQIHWYSKGEKLTADSSLALAVKRCLSINSGGLHAAERDPITPYTAPNSPNILLIINESMGKKAFDFRDTVSRAMPFLRDWINSEPDRFFVFDRAFTNSGATDVSVPSLLTGAAPWESSRKLHTMPLLWDWGRAGGMKTLFVSAQLYNWGNFDSFLLSPGPDVFVTPTQMQAPLFNDVGVDELFAVRRLCEELRALPCGSRFLAVYNSNALHWPFQQKSPLTDRVAGFASPYQNAATILDQGFRLLKSFLDSTGLIDNTLIILTADHGENDKLEHARVNRLYCFYDEVTNIPFLIRLPSTIQLQHPDWAAALRENEPRIVSNLDIAPTILDVIGADDIPANRPLAAAMLGQSLLQPVSRDRYAITLNTNDIRQWDHEGFGIARNDLRFVYSDLEGIQLFDVAADPRQTSDLWLSAGDSLRRAFLNIVDSTFHLKRMFSQP